MAKTKKKRINKNLKRAVIYIRYSSTNQSDGYSIEYQLEQAKAYAERNGYTIVGEYLDTAKTAKKTAGRDELFQMINDAGKDIFDIIIVFSFNRAFRNTRDALNVHFDLMEKYGIPVASVIEPIDMTTPHGKFSATNLFAMHELSSDITAEHVKAAMYYAIQQGYYMGGKIPFGYTVVGTGEFTKGRERKRFSLCPTTAPIVKQIFDMYNSGMSTLVIAKTLNDKGILNKNGKPLSPNNIRRIIAFDGYTGTSVHHFKGYDTLTTDALYPKIITIETYETATEERKKRGRKTSPRYSGKDYYYYFTGKSYCGRCGRPTTINTTRERRNRYYCCSSIRTVGVKSCKKSSVRCDTTDKLIMDAIYEHILNKEAIKTVAKEVFTIAQKTKKPDIDIASLKRRQKEIKEALKELLNKSIYKKISEDVFNETSAEHNEELASIEKQIALAERTEKPITEESVVEFLKSIKKQDKSNIHSAKAIFDTFVDKVTFYDDKISVVLIVPPIMNRGTNGRANVPLYNISIIIEL